MKAKDESKLTAKINSISQPSQNGNKVSISRASVMPESNFKKATLLNIDETP